MVSLSLAHGLQILLPCHSSFTVFDFSVFQDLMNVSFSFAVLLIVGTMVAVCVLLSVALSRAIYIRARHKSRHSLGPAVIESGKIDAC